jgi:hypothetical protein
MQATLPIAMTACPRDDILLPVAIRNLRNGGFMGDLHVFGEPGIPTPPMPGVQYHVNEQRLGGHRNYLQALQWMLANTPVRYFMMVEDDVLYCRGAAAAVLRGITRQPNFVLRSLYLPIRYSKRVQRQRGWFPFNLAFKTYGLLAICYDREGGIQDFIADPKIQEAFTGAKLSYDGLLYNWMQQNGRGRLCFNHLPSLVDHVGPRSNQGHRDSPYRQGLGFKLGYVPTS